MAHCFTYGTLMHVDIMGKLLGKRLPQTPSYLTDYAAVQLNGQVFPGLIEKPTASTQGILYHDLCASSWQILDAFEGDWYIKKSVTVCIQRPEQTLHVTALTYLLAPAFRHLACNTPWDFEDFCKNQAAKFLQTID